MGEWDVGLWEAPRRSGQRGGGFKLVEAWGRITGASPWPRPGRDGERAGRSGRFPVGFGAIARQRAAEDGAAVPAGQCAHDSDRVPCSLSV